MARIEIYDDWGKLAETIEIVSADAKDLRRAIEFVFEDDEIYQCVKCKKFDHDSALIGCMPDELCCVACDAANRKDSHASD